MDANQIKVYPSVSDYGLTDKASAGVASLGAGLPAHLADTRRALAGMANRLGVDVSKSPTQLESDLHAAMDRRAAAPAVPARDPGEGLTM